MMKKYYIRIKYIFKNNNIKKLHLILLLCTLIFFSIGFAYLSNSLSTGGSATFNYNPCNTLDVDDNLEFRDSEYRDNIVNVTIVDSNNIPNDAFISWDVSVESDKSVMAYLMTNSSDNTKYDLYIGCNDTLYANPDSSQLFYNMTSVQSFNLSLLDTSNVANMSMMFMGSFDNVSSLDLSSFNTDNVIYMTYMFYGGSSCSTTVINLSNWNTENVEDMSFMFANQTALTEIINLEGLNTSNVTSMYGMFECCYSFTSLDLSWMDTSNVLNMSELFYNCVYLESLNLSNFNTSNVTDMSYMFGDCVSLTSLDISNFDASSVTEITDMFDGVTCSIIIPLTTGSISNTTSRYYGSSEDIYVEGTFTIPRPLDLFIAKAKAGNATASDVGTTFTVDLGDTYGEHTLRVANVSSPSECSNTGFSKTACGVVLEFADIITTHNMNPSGTYKGTQYNYGWNVDGWPVSSMRTFVNNDIYNALPSNVKSAIIETSVVSGHGSTSGETNFTSTDKLYLLSTHEVWTDGLSNQVSTKDTSYNNTRQLDYYAGQGVKTSSYSGAIKKNGSTAHWWWLRSADSRYAYTFLGVNNSGDWTGTIATESYGVSPAFRIA